MEQVWVVRDRGGEEHLTRRQEEADRARAAGFEVQEFCPPHTIVPRQELRRLLEKIRDLDEQTSDGAIGSLARRALDLVPEDPRI